MFPRYAEQGNKIRVRFPNVFLKNQFLHLFGWAIVVVAEKDKIVEAYPARVKYRGFDEKSQAKAYNDLGEYMETNIKELVDEVKL